ncbi:aldehyde dehydrogenase family protein, partial [Micromonospora sp. NPDC005222]
MVFADADLQHAARGAAAGFLGNAGQACVAGSRTPGQRTGLTQRPQRGEADHRQRGNLGQVDLGGHHRDAVQVEH